MRIGGADLARTNLLPLAPIILLSISLIIFSLATCALAASPKLTTEEVNALKEIGKKLGKRDWDFSKDPCSGEGNWSTSDDRKGFESYVSCDCTFNLNLTCHVVNIALKGQNLSGIVPPEFSKLRYLTHLDLSRNILNGTLPPQWATMKLTDLSLMGNRLSGPFPTVLTNITTLRNLSIEGNQFSGPIPAAMGNMINLQKCVLSSNAFSGTLPAELGKLVNLTDMRISDNCFSGKIPSFISKWTQIEKLQIHGSGLEGPIPSSISALTSLSDLRISDLGGKGSTFPPLRNMESLKTLVLRNCLLHGNLPKYIADFEKLKHLDISFNKLTGRIPQSFIDLVKTDFIYLTANQLTGSVPQWMLERNKVTDLSYNNFTSESSTQIECPRGSANLVESYISSKDKSVHSCLKQNFPCSASRSQQHYSLRIDCGGKELTASDNTTYEADLEPRGASMYYAAQNWAFSSTGNFMDDDNDADPYIRTNSTPITNASSLDAKLYTTARVSPLSLTYYGVCLMNGNYTVRLHFAEIAFTNDSTFNSLGRRIFDVYIQEKLVLKDFNIEQEAGGTGIPIVKIFNASVSSNTLKIHFYWAGKGTTGIPVRGVYGPLISAISVEPNFRPPTPKHEKTAVIVAGTVSAAVVLTILVLGIMRRKGYLGGKVAEDKELRGLDLQTGIFTLKQLKAATKNFDLENKLGEGGFGAVYKGILSDGSIIAVKQLSAKSKQGIREFVTEIGMISAQQHPNLVKLYGCCVDGNQMMLIYEYMEKNSLSRALFGKDGVRTLKLDWPTRQKICIDVARGLAYLHEESRIKIVHRDIKTSNILLDKNLGAKISDFGLAKLNEDDNTHISTRIAGTIGYMSPEYAMRGYLTNKADVYSFGVVALEIVSGKSNTNYRPKEEFVYLLDWAYVLQERGSLLELVDPDLGSEYSSEEAMVMLNVALLCTNASPTLRPIMSQVVSMLEGRTAVQDLLSDPGFSATTNPKFNAIRKHFWQNASPTHSMTVNGLASTASISNSYEDTEESEHLINVVSVESNE